MGRHRSKITELTNRKLSPKIWIPKGFGDGFYVYRKLTPQLDGTCLQLCESKDGTQQWTRVIRIPREPAAYGMQRAENGKLTKVI